MKKIKLVEYVLPYVVAWSTNRIIREKQKERTRDSLAHNWKQTMTAEDVKFLESGADDLNDSEMRRKDAIESKAASLFEAIGFAVSLVSIAIAFMGRGTLSILLVFPLMNFILAGICSWHATKIGRFYLPTLDGIRENLDLAKEKTEDSSKMHWIIERLVSIEMNCPFILIKSNWLAAAYQHFLLGILSIIVILAIVILGPYVTLIWEFLISAFPKDCWQLT